MLERIGKWKITPLETGRFSLDGGAMMGSVPKVLWEKTDPPDAQNRIRLAMRCLLLDDGEHLVLVESGMGTKIDEKFKTMFNVNQPAAPLESALADVGFKPSDVTHVLTTHLHFDHAGGLTKTTENGNLIPAFPQARYFISRRNWEAGLKPNLRDRASYLKENYLPLQEADVLELVDDAAPVLPGINTLTVDGHTRGQQLIKITDGGETLVFVADLIPLKSHLRLPWIMGYDLHAALTLTEKTAFLKKAAAGNWWLWFYHDPTTAAVRVREGKKYYDITEEIRDGE